MTAILWQATIERMAGKEPDFGPTAATVAENIAGLRTAQGLTYTGLSERLGRIGWTLTPVAVRRIENRERRVTVDDLVALSVALKVSPITLLMPQVDTAGPSDQVTVTGSDPSAASAVWDWLTAARPIVRTMGLLHFGSQAWPRWKRDEVHRRLEEEMQAAREATDQFVEEMFSERRGKVSDGNG